MFAVVESFKSLNYGDLSRIKEGYLAGGYFIVN